MKGFSVDPAELRAAAAELSVHASGLEDQIALRYSMNPQEIGHEGLQLQINEFQQQVADATVRLRHDTREACERLRLIAADYTESDTALAHRILGSATDLV